MFQTAAPKMEARLAAADVPGCSFPLRRREAFPAALASSPDWGGGGDHFRDIIVSFQTAGNVSAR